MAKASGGQNTAGMVERLVRPVVEGMGLRLWDVRFEKEGPDWFLRIFIDRDTPLDTDTCEAVSRAIDPVIDAADPIDQSYYLEVGSPGLGRRLTKPEHCDQLLGQRIRVKLFRPNEQKIREFSGVLESRQDLMVTVRTENGPVEYALGAASVVRLCDDEDLF